MLASSQPHTKHRCRPHNVLSSFNTSYIITTASSQHTCLHHPPPAASSLHASLHHHLIRESFPRTCIIDASTASLHCIKKNIHAADTNSAACSLSNFRTFALSHFAFSHSRTFALFLFFTCSLFHFRTFAIWLPTHSGGNPNSHSRPDILGPKTLFQYCTMCYL